MRRKDVVGERWMQRCGTMSKCDMLSISGMLVERHGTHPLRMAGILRCISDAIETRALMRTDKAEYWVAALGEVEGYQ